MSPLDPQSRLLSRLMDGGALRHQVVSHNLANIETPGYRRLHVDFEEQLASALDKTDLNATRQGALAADVRPVVKETAGDAARQDGNTVDLDREIGELQRNALLFQTYSQLLQARLGMMRRAIDGS